MFFRKDLFVKISKKKSVYAEQNLFFHDDYLYYGTLGDLILIWIKMGVWLCMRKLLILLIKVISMFGSIFSILIDKKILITIKTNKRKT